MQYVSLRKREREREREKEKRREREGMKRDASQMARSTALMAWMARPFLP